MMKEKRVRGNVYRLPPCPSYDVEGMESWLTDMAGKGLVLAKDGIFAGVAAFERDIPKAMRYRLEAAPKSTSMWAGDFGEPDPEAVALNGEYGWEYRAKRGDFYIYVSEEPGVRELNTDPKVQAMALHAVKRRQKAAAFHLFFWLVIYVGLQLRDSFLLTMVQIGTGLFLLGAFLAFWLSADALMEVIFLGKLQKKLFAEGSLNHTKNWRKNAASYYGRRGLKVFLVCVWVCCMLLQWNASVLEKDKISLDEYQGELPFATIEDFAGEGAFGYQGTALGAELDYVKEWNDWLAPFNVKWAEHAMVTRADGTVINGGLYVDYHEVINPQIAKLLALEYVRHDMQEKETVRLEVSLPEVSYAEVYLNGVGFPTVVIQNETMVLHGTFYQISSEEQKICLEEWIQCMADSINRKAAQNGG